MSVFLPVQALPQAAVAFPCSYCWPRIAMTHMRENGNPICTACAENPRRRRTMPKFVVASIQEASRHD